MQAWKDQKPLTVHIDDTLHLVVSDSTCTAVASNYTAYSNTVYLILSPGIPGCSSDAAGAAVFRVGQMNVNADSLKGCLSTALSAYLSGKRVQIFFDPSTPACFSNALSVGGTTGQCN
jgi:hypothetical protein